MRWLRAIISALIGLAALPAHAQDLATLIADQVTVEEDNRLVAQGQVEVLFDGKRLMAQRVVYDSSTDQLTIEGPMRIVSDDGTLFTAEGAQISGDLSNGLLRSARLVLDQQLQLASAEILRVDGRYTVLNKTVTSSCTVCQGQPVPLWQIRAKRVVHDQLERQLYFDNARLEVLGLPIVYLPRMRLPDPTLERANGFLTPQLRINNQLGFGIKTPYFITLGPHADVTLTPYFANGYTRTLETRLRKAFAFGEVELNGAVSQDSIRNGNTRAYLFAEGEFDLPRDFELTFGLQSVSDDAYLLDYEYSSSDRLTSFVKTSRTRRDEHITGGLTFYETLRESESDTTIPRITTDALWERRFHPDWIGGVATLRGEAYSFARRSSTDITGRDQTRLSLSAAWRGDWRMGNGMLLAAQSELAFDHFEISDDSTTDSPISRVTPFVATELRWPLIRSAQNGYQVLEPMLQLVWSDMSDDDVPVEESLSVSFDEGNLFSLSRFAGSDTYEQGLRANLGANWTHFSDQGWQLGLTAGRVIRQSDEGQFTAASGLEGITSDWLAAVRFSTDENLQVSNRALIDDSLGLTRNELRLDWVYDRLDLASSYIWQRKDVTENRESSSSEWELDMSYDLLPNLTGSADWRYNFAASEAIRAGLGLEYRNECVTVDVSLSRRFTSSTNVNPTTDFGLTISLSGFGNSAETSQYRRRCSTL